MFTGNSVVLLFEIVIMKYEAPSSCFYVYSRWVAQAYNPIPPTHTHPHTHTHTQSDIT